MILKANAQSTSGIICCEEIGIGGDVSISCAGSDLKVNWSTKGDLLISCSSLAWRTNWSIVEKWDDSGSKTRMLTAAMSRKPNILNNCNKPHEETWILRSVILIDGLKQTHLRELKPGRIYSNPKFSTWEWLLWKRVSNEGIPRSLAFNDQG